MARPGACARRAPLERQLAREEQEAQFSERECAGKLEDIAKLARAGPASSWNGSPARPRRRTKSGPDWTRRASKPSCRRRWTSGASASSAWPRCARRSWRTWRRACAQLEESRLQDRAGPGAAARPHRRRQAQAAGGPAQRGAVCRSVWRRPRRDEEALLPQAHARAESSGAAGAIWPGSAQEIADLGAVNLAALEELTAARERKGYPRRPVGGSERRPSSTLEDAIRRIDRETREQLRGTYDAVNKPLRRAVPRAVRRRRGAAGADRRGDPGCRRPGRRPAAGQEERVHPPAVGRREGAHGDRAGVLAVPAQSGAVLPARRGGCAARRHATPNASATW
ncbi:MAG: hypothetical protein MZW92_78290 [Comamonadaceae bacterium]|nr:hypothetical protein [Comamonadaceae bacterium]